MQIPAYLVIGTPTSGRRGVVWDAVERGSMEGEFSVVFVSAGEKPSDFDAAIAGADNAGIVKYSDAADAFASTDSEEGDENAPAAPVIDENKVPVVTDNISEFTVVIEYVEVVKDAPKKGADKKAGPEGKADSANSKKQ